MIGENIKKYRLKNGLTQKDLADKLYVTSQAISRWEKEDVEPSISTITQMAKIFNISVDELVGNKVKNEKVEEKKIDQKQVLAVCETCKQPIYDSSELIIKKTGRNHIVHYLCKTCVEKEKEQKRQETINKSLKNRKKSFVIGGILLAICLFIAILSIVKQDPTLCESILVLVMIFTLVSCCLFNNNFVGDLFLKICSFGFVKMPGVIFSFSLDGFIFLIVAKVVLAIISVLIALFMTFIAFIIAGILSIFVYPFALKKNIDKPDFEY